MPRGYIGPSLGQVQRAMRQLESIRRDHLEIPADPEDGFPGMKCAKLTGGVCNCGADRVNNAIEEARDTLEIVEEQIKHDSAHPDARSVLPVARRGR